MTPKTYAFAVACLGLAGCASLPEAPLNAAPPLTVAERLGIRGVPHSEVIELAGEPTLPGQQAERGGVLVSMPFRYRHTAVLTQDVIGFSITVSGVQAPAGSPGYYAGTFGSNMGGGGDLWCFLPSIAGGERDNICLLRTSPRVAAIAPTRMNPYLWLSFAPATGTFDYVEAPVFERRQVDIPRELVLDYRFRSWTDAAARLSQYAVGREVRDFEISRNPDGTATLRTIGGVLTIRQEGDAAIATLAPLAP